MTTLFPHETIRNNEDRSFTFALLERLVEPALPEEEREEITWTLERSGRINEEVIPSKDFYYQSVIPALKNDGDILVALDVLARDVGIIGIFSDWPATVTYYANCMGLK